MGGICNPTATINDNEAQESQTNVNEHCKQLEKLLRLNPNTWNISQVALWLKYYSNGQLSKLAPIFVENAITGNSFCKLNIDDLKNELNVKQYGLRAQFIEERDKAVNKFKIEDTPNTNQNDIGIGNRSESIVYQLIVDNTAKERYSNINSSPISCVLNTKNSPYGNMSFIDEVPFNNRSSYLHHYTLPTTSSRKSTNVVNNIPSSLQYGLDLQTPQISIPIAMDENGHYSSVNINDLNVASQSMINHQQLQLQVYPQSTPQFIVNSAASNDICAIYDMVSMEDIDQQKLIDIQNVSFVAANSVEEQLIPKNVIQEIRNENENKSENKKIVDTDEEIKQIKEFARKLWRILINNEYLQSIQLHNDIDNKSGNKSYIFQSFTAAELIKHIAQYLINNDNYKNESEIIVLCNELLKHKYIRFVCKKNTNTDNKIDENIGSLSEFVNKDGYLYQFENDKHREFITDDQHRRAWTQGTKVQIFSATLGGWQQNATIVDCKRDTLTITYGGVNDQIRRKCVNRFQEKLVKSMPEFVKTREEWSKSSAIEIYSHGKHIWCTGHIQDILPISEERDVDIFRVFYTDYEKKDFSKYVTRWSPDLRPVQNLTEGMQKFKRGTKVRVWSEHKKAWVDGIVIDTVPEHEVVSVRYGDHEKLLPIVSDNIQLIGEEQMNDIAKPTKCTLQISDTEENSERCP